MKKEYKKLELDKILELLSVEAWSDACKERITAIEPFSDIYTIKEEIGKTSTAFTLSAKYGTPRFYKIKDVCSSIKRAKSGSNLSLRELLDIGSILREISGLRSWCLQFENIESVLDYLFNQLVPNKSLEEIISTAIISEEELSDNASPELAKIRKNILRQSAIIKEQLDKIIKTKEKSLQENLVTMRDGRYVVPVKIEHKNEVSGLVHDTSSSGATLFIEPMSVVEANNEIRILKGLEQLEIERIIKDMSVRVGNCAEALIAGFSAAIELEVYFAKSNLGAKMHASIPIITDEPVLELNKARHPLIDKDSVVPITLTLGNDFSCLIVTGPNTGGKTVAIKTAGLLTLMAKCGLLIPANDNSKIGFFTQILPDIGDEQSIEQSLSTFSSHMNNIINILKIADDKTLVLLDELGSGTDPIEGAALAVSILTYLKNKGCRVIATTHYQEVKMFAIEEDGVMNASCEFDIATLKPTYRLIVGIPGKSNAFAIAKRLGMGDDIIETACGLVTEENKRFERVVEALEKSRQELEISKENIRLEERKTRDLTIQLEKQKKEIELSKDKELQLARAKSLSIIEEVRFNADVLMEELENLRKQKDRDDFAEKIKTAHSHLSSTMNKMYDEANPVESQKADDYVLPRPLKIADTIKLLDTDKKGSILSLPDTAGNCFVQVGAMKIKTNVRNIRLVKNENAKQNKVTVSKVLQSNMSRKSSMELDIRGKMVDEGIMELDMFIDNCILSGISIVTIIHGKGTGALRAAVQQFLKNNKNVKSYRIGVYGEGDAGVTVAELK